MLSQCWVTQCVLCQIQPKPASFCTIGYLPGQYCSLLQDATRRTLKERKLAAKPSPFPIFWLDFFPTWDWVKILKLRNAVVALRFQSMNLRVNFGMDLSCFVDTCCIGCVILCRLCVMYTCILMQLMITNNVDRSLQVDCQSIYL